MSKVNLREFDEEEASSSDDEKEVPKEPLHKTLSELDNADAYKLLFSDYLSNLNKLKYPIELGTIMEEYGDDFDEGENSPNSPGSKISDAFEQKHWKCCSSLERFSYGAKMIILLCIGNLVFTVPAIVALIVYYNQPSTVSTPTPDNPEFMARILIMSTIFLVVFYSSFLLSHVIIKNVKNYIRNRKSLSERHRILEYIRRLHIPLTFVMWLICVLICWSVLYPIVCSDFQSATCAAGGVTGGKILIGLLVTSIIWSIEKFFLQMTAVKFNSKAYEQRIVDNRRNCYIISQLKSIPKKLSSERLNDKISHRIRNFVQHSSEDSLGSTSTTESSSSSIGEASKVSKFYNLRSFKRHLKKTDKKSTLPKLLKKTTKTAELVFAKCCPKDAEYIQLDDFYKYFKTKKFAAEAFKIFDTSKSGKIFRRNLKRAILEAFIEKNHITNSLLGLETVLVSVDYIYKGFCAFILFFIWISIFELAVQTVLSITLSLVAAIVFAVGDAAKNTLSSIIFLFSWHPYDVGDKVEFDQTEYVVYKIHLLITVFRRMSGEEVYFPNAILNQKSIVNLRRSPDTWSSTKIYFDFDTRPDAIQAFRAQLETFVLARPDDFYPSFGFSPFHIDVSKEIGYSISVQHRSNFQNSSLKSSRQVMVFNFIIDTLKQLNIRHSPKQRIELAED